MLAAWLLWIKILELDFRSVHPAETDNIAISVADSLYVVLVHMVSGGNLEFLCKIYAGENSPQLRPLLPSVRAQQLGRRYEQQFNVANVEENLIRSTITQNFRILLHLEDQWDGLLALIAKQVTAWRTVEQGFSTTVARVRMELDQTKNYNADVNM